MLNPMGITALKYLLLMKSQSKLFHLEFFLLLKDFEHIFCYQCKLTQDLSLKSSSSYVGDLSNNWWYSEGLNEAQERRYQLCGEIHGCGSWHNYTERRKIKIITWNLTQYPMRILDKP